MNRNANTTALTAADSNDETARSRNIIDHHHTGSAITAAIQNTRNKTKQTRSANAGIVPTESSTTRRSGHFVDWQAKAGATKNSAVRIAATAAVKTTYSGSGNHRPRLVE